MGYVWNPIRGGLDFVKCQTGVNGETLQKDLVVDQTISALRMVRATSSTNVNLADYSTFNESVVLGMAISAATVGNTTTVVTHGCVKDPSFTFPVNDTLFLLSNGTITNAPIPLGGGFYTVRIGHSLGSGAIFIDIEEPIDTRV